jgi:hypothetical protein
MSSMRNTLNVVRYDWLGVRIGGPGASMRGLWPVLILACAFVFGCFFAVGRLSAGGAAPPEGSSAAPVARAVIPSELRGGSPIAGKVPSAIAEPPPRRRPVPTTVAGALSATAPSQSLTGEVAGGEASLSSPAERAPAAEPAPSEAPAPSQAPARTGSATGSKGGSGGTPSGGGSFDSSE